MSIHDLDTAPSDAISSLSFTPDSNTLVVGAWDNAIYIYRRTQSTPPFNLSSKIECDAPVLDVCAGADNNTVYAVGLDHTVTQYTISEGSSSRKVLSRHTQPSNKVAYSSIHHVILSLSWDNTMHVHDAAAPNRYVPVKLAAKPFALSLTQDKAAITMAERKVHVFALRDLKTLISQAGGTADRQPLEIKPWQERESSLKFMTRASATMPDGQGFAAASIEGRVGVEWFDEEANKNMYAFKCHRDKTTVTNEQGQECPVDVIYPVNAVAFHPVFGTFATGGGDGVVAIWDANTKRRVRQYPKLPSSVAALQFSADGKFLALAISPGFEDGKEAEETDPSLVKVFVRELGESEAKGKPAKEK